MIEFSIPIRTVNALNVREHWAKRAKRAKSERRIAALVMPRGTLPCTVTLTRIAPREMDGDGLQASFKNIRDGIADKLGVNDNDPRVTWAYAQERFNKKIHLHRSSVRINIAQSAQEAGRAA